jgi:hypothetical protein
MPVVRVQRIVGTVAVNDLREQQVETLVFGGRTDVVLDASAFTTAGTYSIFKYTTFAGGQTDLNTYVTFSMSGPGLTVSNVHGFDDTANSRVTVTLV